MNLSPFKRDIDELIDEFVEDDLTTFADMKSVWLSRKFSHIYEASPNSNLAFFMQSLYVHTIGHMVSIDSFSRRLGGLYCLYCLHEIQPFKPKFRIYISLQELGKFRDLVVEAKDKGVEIAAAVAKKMLDENMLIFGAVDETSATKTIHQLTELQNARVRFAYEKLICDTSINQFIHLDMGKEVDLNSLDKMSIEYAEAKKRAVEGEIMEIDDIKHISEEKELMGERMEKLKEEWDSQRLYFYEQTKLDGFTTTPKQLTNVEHDEDDGFDELDRLLSQS
ncbi:Small nuclear RNA activating complex (SNAPc), subunit SNAP43 protein [Arabidopsis thaliana]|uniref:Small nuclear RNA activating complex (SNAPc), subunit SNAP43 protein n=1 Tax=Arabidopsis thaliana TaxID=3702 RepID=F4J9B1_ARATH|nr:Small nuclear RNA activating complex (SNAPc), subunit SNAP43 protein [Arabidopsis thaliana]AEE79061.1 Small nuclear RNA activating complex (SNAPc), subunit SNAP43 protein [Arabidopsis thaliana]|eukprot:NP_001190076.1 Small nuclear RNA activating complex (SNAPc), subunit SNAP43 protein [Arabidopsis thaliana]